MKRILVTLTLTASALLSGCSPSPSAPLAPQAGDVWGWTLHQVGPGGPTDVVVIANTILSVTNGTVTYLNRNGRVTDLVSDFTVSARLIARPAR